ncbi:MAG: carboxypeptidase-like regulatory domain-containing protein [Myxococcota bacterium]|jgi:hypothetical protein|nr:carboxypeptidase-like regulatory domain-containing protein [Myxococcota bacterium]
MPSPLLLVMPGLLTACEPGETVTEILLTGHVLDEQDEEAGPIPEATIELRDGNTEAYSEATTDEDGAFSIAAPAGDNIYVSLSADGYTTTAFTGATSYSDVEVEDGTLWMRSEAQVDVLRNLFDGCSLDDGGIVEGEVRVYIPDQDADELPLVTTAYAVAYTPDGDAYEACYLDDEGNSDPEATQTGNTGRFAIFGLPEAPLTVYLNYDPGAGDAIERVFYVYLPENGIAPLYPAYVELP